MAAQWLIKGRNCLVTGGASGIGAKKVEVLLKEGAEAVALLDINEVSGRSIAELHNKSYPGKVTFIKCNMADEDSVTSAFNQVVEKFKRIDLIINNAGILNDSPTGWSTCVDVNLKGVISMTRKGLNHMAKDKGGAGGTIANVASVAAFMETDTIPVYCATKSAVLWFGKCLSAGNFHKTTGIRVLTICYGATETPMLHMGDILMFNGKQEELFKDMVKRLSTQSAESAANACVEMIKKGANGSLWLSMNGALQEFTDIFNTAYDSIRALME